MKLNNSELYNFYVEKGINYLYHANTVSTSLTYFEEGGILSRGAVEEQGLFQTPQNSDEADKILEVWDDVFIDTADLHSFFGRQNHYGPVLFEFLPELILNEEYEIWITKDNPIYWNKETPNEDRYFSSVQELKELWDKIPRQKKMTTIRNNKSPILFEYLNKIIVDDPRTLINKGTPNEIHLFNEAKKKLKENTNDKPNLSNKFIVRTCTNCYCRDNYLNEVKTDVLKKYFI